MRKATVFVNGIETGMLTEFVRGKNYGFEYFENYLGSPVSLALPLSRKRYDFDSFPPFLDGLLPEGYQLEGLLKFGKIDRNDLFSQLMAVGDDLVGNVTVREITL